MKRAIKSGLSGLGVVALALASGAVVVVIQKEFGITQASVSQHLKVLRESGFATVRVDGARRLYTIDSGPLKEVDAWLDRFRGFWAHKLNALATEVARGKRARQKTGKTKARAKAD